MAYYGLLQTGGLVVSSPTGQFLFPVNRTDNFEILAGYTWAASAPTLVLFGSIDSGYSQAIASTTSSTTSRIQIRNQNGTITNFDGPSLPRDQKFDIKIERIAQQTRIYVNNIQFGNARSDVEILNVRRFHATGATASALGNIIWYFEASVSGVQIRAYYNRIGSGLIFTDEINSINGEITGAPVNNSQWVFYDDGAGEPEFKFSVLPITLGLNQSYFVNKLVNTNINSSIGQLDFINENSKGAATQLNQALDLDFINENSKGAATQLNQVLGLDYYSECSKETRTTLPIEASVDNTLTNKKLSSFSLPIDFSLNSELSSKKYGYSTINENLELVSILSYIRQDNPGAGTIDIRFQLGSSYTHKKSASTTYYTDLICDSIYVNSKEVYNTLYQGMALEVSSIADKSVSSNIDSSMELASTVVHSKTASSTYSSSLNLYQDYQVSKATRNPYQVNIGQLSISLTNFNLDNKQPIHKVTILSNETTVFRVNPVIFTVFRTTR